MKKLTAAQKADLAKFDEAANAAGMANVADNAAKEADAAPTSVETVAAKRGRKPSVRPSLAKFIAALESGDFPAWIVETPEKREGARIVEFSGYKAVAPVITLDEEGNLTLCELTTDNTSFKRKPMEKVIRTISAADVMALLTK